MNPRTNLVLAVHSYERQYLWYVMAREPSRPRVVLSRGVLERDWLTDRFDSYEALLLVATEAYRLHGHRSAD